MGESSIHLDHSDHEGEDRNLPILGVDTLLQQYWRVSGIAIMVINLMPELEMVEKGSMYTKLTFYRIPLRRVTLCCVDLLSIGHSTLPSTSQPSLLLSYKGL